MSLMALNGLAETRRNNRYLTELGYITKPCIQRTYLFVVNNYKYKVNITMAFSIKIYVAIRMSHNELAKSRLSTQNRKVVIRLVSEPQTSQV